MPDVARPVKAVCSTNSVTTTDTNANMTTVRDLNHLYTNPSLSIEAKREGKQKAFRELRARFEALKKSWGVSETPYDAWFSKPLNNARLSSIATYNEWVPAFEAMLKANGGDLEKFYTLVKRLGKMPNERRIKTLKAYMCVCVSTETLSDTGQ